MKKEKTIKDTDYQDAENFLCEILGVEKLPKHRLIFDPNAIIEIMVQFLESKQ